LALFPFFAVFIPVFVLTLEGSVSARDHLGGTVPHRWELELKKQREKRKWSLIKSLPMHC